MIKDYVIIDGEKIYLDEEPDKEDFEKWLRRVEDLLEKKLEEHLRGEGNKST